VTFRDGRVIEDWQAGVNSPRSAVYRDSARQRPPSQISATRSDAQGDASPTAAYTPTGHAASSRVVSQIRRQNFEKEYAAFFAKYPVSKEQKDLIALANFNDSVARSRSRAQTTNGFDVKIYREEKQARERQFEETLRKPLGDELFEALVYYRDTKSQRYTVDTIAAEMKASGCALSTETYDKLVRIFKDKNASSFLLQSDSPSSDFVKLEARMLAEKEGAVMGEAATVLNPQQMDVLKQVWSKWTSPAREGNSGGETDGKEY